MKNLLFAVSAVLILSSCCARKKMPTNQSNPSLEKVVEAVQTEYALALTQIDKETLKHISLNEADLTLTVTKAVIGSADLQVLIFKPSDKYTRTHTTAITYTLSEKNSEMDKIADKHSMLADNKHSFSKLIVQTVNQYANIKSTVGTLTKDNFVIDLTFSIENDAALGLTFNVWNIGFDASAESDNTVAQELKLTFNYNK